MTVHNYSDNTIIYHNSLTSYRRNHTFRSRFDVDHYEIHTTVAVIHCHCWIRLELSYSQTELQADLFQLFIEYLQRAMMIAHNNTDDYIFAL